MGNSSNKEAVEAKKAAVREAQRAVDELSARKGKGDGDAKGDAKNGGAEAPETAGGASPGAGRSSDGSGGYDEEDEESGED